MVTDEQVALLRRNLMAGKTQEEAAARAGMSARTARKWQKGGMPSQTERRRWRTRPDPFDGVWEEQIVPRLRADTKGELEATTLLDHLITEDPERFSEKQLRTLQRRIRDWRAVEGPEREVFFEQEHPPGREASFDFTHCSHLGVTIRGEPLDHLLFQLRLSCSGWVHVELAFAETYEAMLRGIQSSLWSLGAQTDVLRHDNLSAATHELKKAGGRALNRRFQEFLNHYGLRSTRIRPGESNENGGVEKANDLLKRALRQALILRGHAEFDSAEAYEAFVQEVVEQRLNNRRREALAKERPHLRPLPACRLPEYTQHRLKVRRWSTIRVLDRTYSVPSRLIGRQVDVHLYADRLELLYGGRVLETMPRLLGDRTARIDYRHVIHSLVAKPGAFTRYKYREELFPSLVFRRAYDALVGWRGERANVDYVRILSLAATTLEGPVERALEHLLAAPVPFDYGDVKSLAAPEPMTVPQIDLGQVDLAGYDRLLQGGVQ